MSLTILQSPITTKFAADCQDLILQSADSVDFTLKQNDNLIISETYNPDMSSQIAVRGISEIISSCLYGDFLVGSQANGFGTFTFMFGTETAATAKLYNSHFRNGNDLNGKNVILSHAKIDVSYPGIVHYLTMIGNIKATLYGSDDAELANTTLVGSDLATIDCDPKTLFPDNYTNGSYIKYVSTDDATLPSFKSFIIQKVPSQANIFRFLNIYDMPETVVSRVPITVKPTFSDSVSYMNNQKRRFDVTPTDEYTCDSGAMMLRDEYFTWRDFMNCRRAEILFQDNWYPIIVTKSNFTQTLDSSVFDKVEFNFTMSKIKDNGIISI